MRNISRHILATICVLVVSALALSAQDYQSSIRKWDEGPLTMRDFQVRDMWTINDKESCLLTYGTRWEVKKKRYGNLVYHKDTTEAYMDKVNSWIRTGYDTPATLRYMQVSFDIIELTRRKFQNEADTSSTNFLTLANFYNNVGTNALNEFKAASRMGQDTTVVNQYRSRISKALDEYVLIDSEPTIRFRKFGLGVRVGIGSEFFFGQSTDYLTPLGGMTWGFEMSLSRFRFNLDGLLGIGGDYKKDFPYSKADYNWREGDGFNGGSINQTFGYAVIDNKRVTIAPMAGIGVGSIDRFNDDAAEGKKNEEMAGFRMLAGVDFDWKIRRYYTRLSYDKVYAESNIRFRLYAARTSLPSPCNAWSINFGAAYELYARAVK